MQKVINRASYWILNESDVMMAVLDIIVRIAIVIIFFVGIWYTNKAYAAHEITQGESIILYLLLANLVFSRK